MLLPLLMLLQAPPSLPSPPRREIPDPGVIATDQRVAPAGLQSVFTGRVTGVRFGARPGEIWVTVPGALYRLGWRDNAVLGSTAFDGHSGALRLSSPALGAYIAGGPMVARHRNASGHRVVAVPLPANDELAVLDADDGSLLRRVALGVLPVAAVLSEDGAIAYVSNFGGRKPTARDRSAKQCCDPYAELVRVDARGMVPPGSVTRVDLVAGTVSKVIPVGLHPTGLAWDEKGGRLYVANGNSDNVSVIDTRHDSVIATISVAPFREHKIGFAPTAVALSPDGATLFVTLGGLNAVAMYTVTDGSARLRGLIPTGWYPTTIDVGPDGSTIAVGTLFGVGSGV